MSILHPGELQRAGLPPLQQIPGTKESEEVPATQSLIDRFNDRQVVCIRNLRNIYLP
jgi:hypothetical protein